MPTRRAWFDDRPAAVRKELDEMYDLEIAMHKGALCEAQEMRLKILWKKYRNPPRGRYEQYRSEDVVYG